MKLTYFDLRGVAERSRYLLAIAGVDYEDERFSFKFGTPGDFSTIIRPEFDQAKASGRLDISLGKVPLLETDDGKIIPQSKSIERYIAKKYGMMGATDEEAAYIDALAEHQRDAQDAYKAAKAKDQANEYLTTTLPETLQKVEKSLSKSGPFLNGEKVCLADVCFYYFLTQFFDDKEAVANAVATAPRIKSAVEAVGALSAVKKWEQTRPDTIF